jgi:hypothetical protein
VRASGASPFAPARIQSLGPWGEGGLQQQRRRTRQRCVRPRQQAALYAQVKGQHPADLKKLVDVWKSQPSLNDFDAGIHMRAKISELSTHGHRTPFADLLAAARAPIRDRLRFTAASSIFLQAFAWAGIVGSVCIPTQTLRSITGGLDPYSRRAV